MKNQCWFGQAADTFTLITPLTTLQERVGFSVVLEDTWTPGIEPVTLNSAD